VFLTSFYTSSLQKYLQDFKIEQIYEKPIQLSKLKEILSNCKETNDVPKD
jgi:hypothetical protein